MNHPFEAFELRGRTALVTGGGTGLGRHMSRALARAGAQVVICARREQVLRDTAADLNADPAICGRVSYHVVDLARRESIRALIDATSARFGGADIFIGNAAIDCLEHVELIKDESIDAMCQVNISANVELIRGLVPYMRKQQWGRVILISSATTICTSPHEGAGMYTAVKGALNAFTRTCATELGHDGITVNSLVLGMFLTDIVRDIFSQIDQAHGPGAGDAAQRSFSSMTALGRLGECQEVEGVVQLLASEAGRYITGSSLVLDGGISIMLRPHEPRAV
ncbi:MAG TPA: SDR family oxidoreductase [Steroidobacteraceae bacterium]|nr:SDR family oxidoreductase [Steroidobacteraceae bacterium]